MERRFVVVAVAIVLLAGCSALGGGASNSPQTTTLEETETGVGDVQLPTGLSESGVEKGQQLLLNHRSVVTNDSYTLRFEKTVNGTATRSVVRVNPETATSLSHFEQSDRDGTHEIYQAGGTRYVKNDLTANETEYIMTNESFAAPITVGKVQSFRYMLAESDYANPTTVETAGEPAVRYDIEGFRGKDIATGGLTVTESGVIEAFDITLEMENTTYEYSYTITDRGETDIAEPDWIDKAEANTDANTTDTAS